jgi:hypothetical protein
MRFDRLVRPGMLVRDVRVRHPGCVPVLERHGFRESCDDCSIEQVARKHGLDPLEIVAELNAALLAPPGDPAPD